MAKGHDPDWKVGLALWFIAVVIIGCMVYGAWQILQSKPL